MSDKDPRIARLRQENTSDRAGITNPHASGKHDPDDIAFLLAAYDERGRKIDAALALAHGTIYPLKDDLVYWETMHYALTTTPEKPEGKPQ
jgi:hypothetical protein